MKTSRCKYPCVSLGTTGSSLPSGIRCACLLLNPVPSINITCYETKLSPGNTACQCKGGGGGSAISRAAGGSLICTWSAHAESRTQRYTDKRRDTRAETAEKTQGRLQLGSEEKRSRVRQDRKTGGATASARYTSTAMLLIRERRRYVPRTERARRLENSPETWLVGATQPTPRPPSREPGKPVGYREQSQWRERRRRRPGWREVHLLTLPHTAMQYSSVSKLFRLPPHPP